MAQSGWNPVNRKISKSLSIDDIRNQGFTYYEIISNEGACPVCKEHNGEIVSVASAQDGINFPPFHPNCKCTIVGHLLNPHDDPWSSETNVWNEIIYGDVRDDLKIQKLRDFYRISDEYSDTEILIYLLASTSNDDGILISIENFIKRLNPSWVDPDLSNKFSYDWTSEYIDDKFLQKVADISGILGVSPDDLMAVMASESRLDPTASNRFAVGLIQFTDPACRHIGTTREALADMSAVEQLDWVYRYFEGNIGKINNAIDIYWTMCTNKPIGQNKDDVIFDSEDTAGAGYYNNNSGMDHDGDGKITRGDLEEHLKIQLDDYWNNWAN